VQAIHYTSGTTGVPKGVVRSHDANFAVGSAGAKQLPMGPDDAWYTVLPFNSAAYYGMVLPPMEVGARFVMDREFDPAAALERLESERITHALLVPTMWEMMIRDPGHSDVHLSALRHPLWGGSTSTQGLVERLADWLPHTPLSAYGLTEAPFVTYSTPEIYASGRWDASGSPVSTIEIRVTDDDGANMPVGDYGEIQLRGPLMMDEYFGRPDLTAGVLGDDGWFSTGDWGRLDPDGVLTVADRKKDMIISGGENIYPAELENVISMLPGVAQVAVVGLPNELWGQEVCAVVLRTDDALRADDVVAHCLDHVASFKKPRRVEFCNELPMTATGKVLKHELVSSLSTVEHPD
jgi:acyl-CoA synthetase (AMP-forming)/AMP-acid ligase II